MISEKLSTDSRRMLQNGVPQFVGFCRCTPCRQRRGKGCSPWRWRLRRADAPRAGSAEAKSKPASAITSKWTMHPVQAAPRQSNLIWIGDTSEGDAPRAGSAEAKRLYGEVRERGAQMHPVQAAPRQRSTQFWYFVAGVDAPRAGSAEAKKDRFPQPGRSARDAPRAGSAEAKITAWDCLYLFT